MKEEDADTERICSDCKKLSGHVEIKIADGIILTFFCPDVREVMEKSLEAWKNDWLPKREKIGPIEDQVYAFAYWLFRYSGLIQSCAKMCELETENVRLKAALVNAEQEEMALRKMCKRAANIMEFHAFRCPLNPFANFSGGEEHLAEYRQVIKEIKEKIG